MQDFLAAQTDVIERLKLEDETLVSASSANLLNPNSVSYSTMTNTVDNSTYVETSGRVNEHIGPVQFNMGGIQVDAEDVLKRLKERETGESGDRGEDNGGDRGGVAEKSKNEALANFFAGLMKKGGGAA